MQKLLKRQQGFTLVELLVVIAIIAILAVIGLTVFTGLQRGARDAQRKADTEAITRALEAGYNTQTALYSNLGTSSFAGGKIPQDPLNGQNSCNNHACAYCIGTVSGGTPNPAGPSSAFTVSSGTAAGCGVAGSGTGAVAPTQYATILSAAFPDISASNPSGFIVCTNLETGGGNYASGDTFCQGNQR